MKIALICPSNLLYMPYVENYASILNELGLDFDIIKWDRLKIEEQGKFIYRDSKVRHQRGFIDYLRYSSFVLRHIKENRYDKIIVFGLQLVFFLKKLLIKKYSDKYIVDIRDHNRIIKFFNTKKVMDGSAFTVLSSPGYKKWLAESNKYIINHNTRINSVDKLHKVNGSFEIKEQIAINYIGSIRDYDININLINILKNDSAIMLKYHGEGVINEDLENFVSSNCIKNVILTGRYQKDEEEALYINSDMINVLIPDNTINNKTLLPNRLYNALKFGKPILAFNGTYMATQIKKYNLGLIVDSFDRLQDKIMEYKNTFDKEKYENGRNQFINNVLKDNNEFEMQLKRFIYDK